MRHHVGCVAPNRNMSIEVALRFTGNIVVIALLPFRLGSMGAPLWYLPIYAAVAGLMLAVAEDLSFARAIFEREDVRRYTQVRIVLIALLGAVPYLIGMALQP